MRPKHAESFLAIRSRGLQQGWWGPKPGKRTWHKRGPSTGASAVHLVTTVKFLHSRFSTCAFAAITGHWMSSCYEQVGSGSGGLVPRHIPSPLASRCQTTWRIAAVLTEVPSIAWQLIFVQVCWYMTRAQRVSCQFVMVPTCTYWYFMDLGT